MASLSSTSKSSVSSEEDNILTIKVQRTTKSYKNPLIKTIQDVTIYKRAAGEFLGMKLLVDKDYGSGLFVGSIVPNGLIASDGRISENDKVLEINKIDLRQALSSEDAIKALKMNSKKLDIKVMKCPKEFRDPKRPLSRQESLNVNSQVTRLGEPNSNGRKPYTKADYIEKTIILTGNIGDPLGLILAGGVTDRFRLPCFVESILPKTIAGQEKFSTKINKGDLLISANDVDLVEKTLAEVTDIFRKMVKETSGFVQDRSNSLPRDGKPKTITQPTFIPQFSIKLRFVQISNYENSRVDELLQKNHQKSQKPNSFRIPWKNWLLTPANCLRFERTTLHPKISSSYGFTLSGGWNIETGDNSVFITNVQKGGAALEKGLYPGYEIVSIDGICASVMSMEQVDKILKVSDRVVLEYIAWPATLL